MSDNVPRTSAAGGQVLSIGLVGAGEIVSRVHLPVLSACEGIRIAYIADKNAAAAKRVAASYSTAAITVAGDLEQLPHTDVALLALPVNARLPYYELFARRGTHVLAEKPFAATAAEAEHVRALYPDYALACGFQRRIYGSVVLAQKVVAEQWFGPLRSISVAEGALTTKTGIDSRFYDEAGASSGGVLMDLGCHSLDLALQISGATEAIPSEQHFVFDGDIDREVEARLQLRTGDGFCHLNYLVTWLRPTSNTIELHFDHCTAALSCRPSAELAIHGSNNGLQRAALQMDRSGASTVYQAFFLEWMAFLEGVRNRQPSQFSLQSCLPTIRTVEALYSLGRSRQ